MTAEGTVGAPTVLNAFPNINHIFCFIKIVLLQLPFSQMYFPPYSFSINCQMHFPTCVSQHDDPIFIRTSDFDIIQMHFPTCLSQH
jgi:hypothetical protein